MPEAGARAPETGTVVAGVVGGWDASSLLSGGAVDMEPEPEPEPVTLLVKSPNQRHRDLELSADRSWSVGRLKAHLSRVYPERPVRGGPRLPLPAPRHAGCQPRSPRGAPCPLEMPCPPPLPAFSPFAGRPPMAAPPRPLSRACGLPLLVPCRRRRPLTWPRDCHFLLPGRHRPAFPTGPPSPVTSPPRSPNSATYLSRPLPVPSIWLPALAKPLKQQFDLG